MRHTTRLALAATLLLASACGSGGGGTAPAGSTLRIAVTDAPFPFDLVESASVVIREVRVHGSETDGWLTVFSGSSEIDLAPLTGGVTAPLVEASVPPGTYDQVRLIVEAGTVVLDPEAVVDGDSHTFSTADGSLSFPSGAQTGIKLKIDNDIVVTTALSGDLLLDFDLTRSFVFNGPPTHAPGVKRVLFTPVVRATNVSTGGTLSLDVLSDNATPGSTSDDQPLAGATVRVLDDTLTEVATAASDATGHVELSVPPGTYTVRVEAAGHENGEVAGAAVALANLTDLGPVLLAAAQAEITGNAWSDAATPLDPDDDAVLSGVAVDLHVAGEAAVLASTTTDGQGGFRFDALDPGTYDLAFHLAGFVDRQVAGVPAAAPGLFTPLDVRMAALTADLSGTVTDATANAVSGATVTLTDANGDVAASVATDGSGAFSMPGVASGTYVLASGAASRTVVVVGTDPVSVQVEDLQLP